jgi:hypothetical protein
VSIFGRATFHPAAFVVALELDRALNHSMAQETFDTQEFLGHRGRSIRRQYNWRPVHIVPPMAQTTMPTSIDDQAYLRKYHAFRY